MGDFDDWDGGDDYDGDEAEEEEVFEDGDYDDDETYSIVKKEPEPEEEDEDEDLEIPDEDIIETEDRYDIADLPVIQNGDLKYIVIGKEEIDKYGIDNIKRINTTILLKYISADLTYPYLTRYESTTIIIDRATELAKGKLSTIERDVDLKGMEVAAIAEMELKLQKIPIFVIRPRENDSSRVFNMNKAYLIDPNGYNAYGKRLFDGSFT